MEREGISVFWHPDVLLHDTAFGVFESAHSPFIEVAEKHPENDVRLRNMKSILERGPLQEHLVWRDGRIASIEELSLVHEASYIEFMRTLCEDGGGRLSSTTVVSRESWKAARAAVGTALAACEAVSTGQTRQALALVRPPGHHAQPSQADGYCIFNNLAVAVEAASRRGVGRIAVIDWDVHHGNGIQEIFYGRRDVLTISMHMRHGSWGPSHPQTGSTSELGIDDGHGYNINLNMPFGCGDAAYERAFDEVIAPLVDRFSPELIFCAVGQDASQFDPNGRMCLSVDGFRTLGRKTKDLADRHCAGRIVGVQEGGYARTYSAYCLAGTLEGLLGWSSGIKDPMAFLPDDPSLVEQMIADMKNEIDSLS